MHIFEFYSQRKRLFYLSALIQIYTFIFRHENVCTKNINYREWNKRKLIEKYDELSKEEGKWSFLQIKTYAFFSNKKTN